MITALSISAVAIYYSVAGLVAIFAAAALPIMIMGGALEIGKLVTAVWLHRYWRHATWWLKTYLSVAVLVLMFITSMGIFGFLSKAHIEQTATAQEGVAQIERIDSELIRQQAIIARAEQRIVDAEASVGEGNEAIQAQIDREQERINSAYTRIQPAIDEQNSIIESARAADANRTAPYEQQLTSLEEELRRLDSLANDYEARISSLTPDNSVSEPILSQIATIEESIAKVEGQIASGEREQIRQAQITIGAEPDGNSGPNTRRSANAWIELQRSRISQLQSQIADIRSQAQITLENERTRLTNLVSNIRGAQTEAIKARQLEILAIIDNVRATESPAIQTARDEIARIRAGADAQIAQSNILIQNLRESITIGSDSTIETTVAEQQQKIIEANNTIDTLTEQKYALQAEYRKLEAEVGPVKYLAEFIYGEQANNDLLEEAVRWVILIIIFVFDPLAVLLLIASQYTFELRAKRKEEENGESLRLRKWREYEQKRAQRIIDNPGYNFNNPLATEEEKIDDNTGRPNNGRDDRESESRRADTTVAHRDSTEIQQTGHDSGTDATDDGLPRTEDNGGMLSSRVLESNSEERFSNIDPVAIAQSFTSKKKDIELSEESHREAQYNEKEKNEQFQISKTKWKEQNPTQTLKHYKNLYIKGVIDSLPWENYTAEDNYKSNYVQNEEQSENSLFSKIRSSSSESN